MSERGGYDKLAKLYDLDMVTVRKAVDVTMDLVRILYRFVNGIADDPQWFLPRGADGKFVFPPPR